MQQSCIHYFMISS